jgi:uncharacterized protein (TIGR03545 family)
MKKWIRWQGLIGFLLLVVLAGIFWFLIIDSIVEWGIEKAGTAIVGAKVDLDDADVTFFPLGVRLTRLQVTDKDAPMTNAVEIGRLAFHVDGLNLLRRKVIIDEMAAEGIRFGTPRKSSGAIAKKTKDKNAREEKVFKLPSVELPDAKTALKNEKLDSLDQIEKARTEVKTTREKWDRRIAELPDKKKVQSYRERIKAIKGAGKPKLMAIQEQVKEARAIIKDIESDLDEIKKAKSDFSNDSEALKKRVSEAVRSPMSDVRRIKGKYGFSSEGLANMTDLLFGAKIGAWVDSGLSWYGRLKPLVARDKSKKGKAEVVETLRGKGVDVRFREKNPMPDFLIRKINASVQPEAGTFTGKVLNVTPDQDVLGKPTTLAFTGEGLKSARSVAIDGVFNHVLPARPSDIIEIRMNDVKAGGISLSESGDLPVKLDQGVMDFSINGALRGEALSATIAAQVRNARFGFGEGKGRNVYASAISGALAKVDRFSVTANVTGTLQDYKVRISSDLDRVLKDAVGKLVQEKTAKFEKELTAAIDEKTRGSVKGLTGDMGGLDAVTGKLNASEGELKNVMKEATSQSGSGRIKLPF